MRYFIVKWPVFPIYVCEYAGLSNRYHQTGVILWYHYSRNCSTLYLPDTSFFGRRSSEPYNICRVDDISCRRGIKTERFYAFLTALRLIIPHRTAHQAGDLSSVRTLKSPGFGNQSENKRVGYTPNHPFPRRLSRVPLPPMSRYPHSPPPVQHHKEQFSLHFPNQPVIPVTGSTSKSVVSSHFRGGVTGVTLFHQYI